MTQDQRVELWDSLRAQGVVKGSTLSPRVVPGETIGKVSPEVVGSATTRPSTPITEPSGIPFMMTQKMRTDLFTEGLTREQISNMTPMQGQEYLQNARKARELLGEAEVPQGTSKSNKSAIDKTMDRMRKQQEAAEKSIPDDYSCG